MCVCVFVETAPQASSSLPPSLSTLTYKHTHSLPLSYTHSPSLLQTHKHTHLNNDRVVKEQCSRVLDLFAKSEKLPGLLVAAHGPTPILTALQETQAQSTRPHGGAAYVLAIVHK